MLLNYYCKDESTGAKYDEATKTITFKNGKTLNTETGYVINPSDGGAYQTALDNILQTDDKDLGDLYLAEADYALKYINNDDATAPLSQVGITEADLSNQYDYTKVVGTSKLNGEIKGVSWQAAPGLFLYRPSLAKELLNVEDEKAMQEKVKDWDAFKATAKEVYNASEGKVKLIQGIEDVWQVYRTNRTTSWIDNGKLSVSPEVDDFLELAKYLVSGEGHDLTVGVDQWSTGWNAALSNTAETRTMGAFFSTWGIQWTMLENSGAKLNEEKSGLADGVEIGSPEAGSYGDWRAITGPSPYYWGGTWLVVPPSCDNADIIQDIISYFTLNTESMKNYALGSKDFVNNKEAIDSIIADGFTFDFLGGQDHYTLFKEQLENINVSTMTAFDQTINDKFKECYKSYANGEKDKDAAVSQFKTDVKDLIPSIEIE